MTETLAHCGPVLGAPGCALARRVSYRSERTGRTVSKPPGVTGTLSEPHPKSQALGSFGARSVDAAGRPPKGEALLSQGRCVSLGS